MELDKMVSDWEERYNNSYFDEIVDFLEKLPNSSKIIVLKETLKNIDFIKQHELIGYYEKLTPIEQIFYASWLIYKTHSNFLSPLKIRIDIQCEILCKNKKYVPDFVFSNIMLNEKVYELKNPVIVECDGYDSHSSKEQRNYDTSRENDLKMEGYSVIRFTGTQIYTNPYKCVIQTAKFIYDRNKNQIDSILGENNAT